MLGAPAALPAAGWFTDPASETRLRWWDGSGWTEHTMAAPPPAPPAAAWTPPSIAEWTPPASTVTDEPLRRERRRDRGRRPEAQRTAGAQPATPQLTATDDYVPIGQRFSPVHSLVPVSKPGSPNTRPIWLLALLPLIAAGAQAGLYFGGLLSDWVAPVALAGGLLLVMALLVLADRAALKERHIASPSAWWVLLLPPFAYFMRRRAVLARQDVKSEAPGNAYVLVLLGVIALAVLVLLPLETGLQVDDLVTQAQKLLGL